MDLLPDLVSLDRADEVFLERARVIAHGGWGMVHPNPMVGCVLVKDGRVVSEAYHEVFGGPHAEALALERAGSEAEGSTAYVSLEPCNHFGKTPPCAQALSRAGVRRVVFGATDPGVSSGGGAETLREAGVEVVGPVWNSRAARTENPFFLHTARGRRPFVALKLAMSLDSRIASAPGASTRITGTEAEHEVHRIRTGFDSIMVGAGTLRVDNPRLTPRLVAPGRESVGRIVLLPDGEMDSEAAILEDINSSPLHVFCRETASATALDRLESSGVYVHRVAADSEESALLDLDAVLGRCHELGLQSILCEGGARLAGSLLHLSLVDRIYLFIAPFTLGGTGLPAFGDDAYEVGWKQYGLACRPSVFGADTLITLDRFVD